MPIPPAPLARQTTAGEFIAWATAVVETEAVQTEQALADEGLTGTAAWYLEDLITILTRISVGDVETVRYPLEG